MSFLIYNQQQQPPSLLLSLPPNPTKPTDSCQIPLPDNGPLASGLTRGVTLYTRQIFTQIARHTWDKYFKMNVTLDVGDADTDTASYWRICSTDVAFLSVDIASYWRIYSIDGAHLWSSLFTWYGLEVYTQGCGSDLYGDGIGHWTDFQPDSDSFVTIYS